MAQATVQIMTEVLVKKAMNAYMLDLSLLCLLYSSEFPCLRNNATQSGQVF